MHESSSIVRPLNGTKVLRLDHFVVEESFHWKLSLSLSLVSNSFFFLLQNWTSHNVNKLARGTCWSQPQQMPPVGGREMTDSTQVEVRSHQTRHVQSKQTTLVATTWKMSTRMSPESKGKLLNNEPNDSTLSPRTSVVSSICFFCEEREWRTVSSLEVGTESERN